MKDTYWEKLGENNSTYQMGDNPFRSEVAELILSLNKPGPILEVGCGTGSFYEVLRQHGYGARYKGTDYTHNFIDTCRAKFPQQNTQWVVEDARNLKEKDNSFRTVVCIHTLDHIDDYKKALKELYRVTSRNVIIVLWRPFVEGKENNLNSSGYLDNKNYEDTHLQDYNKILLDKAIDEVGFEILDEKTLEGEKYNYLYHLIK